GGPRLGADHRVRWAPIARRFTASGFKALMTFFILSLRFWNIHVFIGQKETPLIWQRGSSSKGSK
ncbi:hypothetical protein, partial [Novosphingobium clariflavum]